MSEHLEGHLEKPSMSAQMSATLDLCDHELDISIATDSCLICGDTMVDPFLGTMNFHPECLVTSPSDKIFARE
jgi:hypothetical protein